MSALEQLENQAQRAIEVSTQLLDSSNDETRALASAVRDLAMGNLVLLRTLDGLRSGKVKFDLTGKVEHIGGDGLDR